MKKNSALANTPEPYAVELLKSGYVPTSNSLRPASRDSNQPAHTPGPCSTPENDMPWTVFYAASVGQWQIWKGGVLIGTANTEANARLIAAAPELLAALEWLVEKTAVVTEYPHACKADSLLAYRLCQMEGAAKQARAAIARAKQP